MTRDQAAERSKQQFREWLESKAPDHDWPQPLTAIVEHAAHFLTPAPEALPPGLDSDPDRMGGAVCIKGHRYSAAQLIAELADDQTPNNVADNYSIDRQEVTDAVRGVSMLLKAWDDQRYEARRSLTPPAQPTNADLRKLVQHSESPDEHFEDDGERPWDAAQPSEEPAGTKELPATLFLKSRMGKRVEFALMDKGDGIGLNIDDQPGVHLPKDETEKLRGWLKAQAQADPEHDPLVEFFREEAVLEGHEGDNRGWTPAQTAIETIRGLKHGLAALRRELDIARACKPDEFTHLLASERNAWSEAKEYKDKLSRAQADLAAEVARLKRACSKQQDEIQQILGKALGCPTYASDQKTFPGATDADGVCVGEHVAETLAEEIAKRLAAAEARLAEAMDFVKEHE